MSKNNTQNILLYILFAGILLLHSCKTGENEGTITYNIEFNDEERENRPVIDMLPNTMNYYFKNKSSVSEISFMGMFRTAYISNIEAQTNSVIFYFLPKGYCATTQFGEETLGFDAMPGIILTRTEETKEILDFTAHKVHISFEDTTKDEYDIWYTKEFNVENPNWHTPYKEIDGVLLDYRIKMKGISMHLTIDKFSDAPVDSAKFQVPESYNQVCPEEMDEIFDKHLNMF
ncbi:MAG: hypothetical protein R6U95_01140 [Bacteroidales bacterium]